MNNKYKKKKRICNNYNKSIIKYKSKKIIKPNNMIIRLVSLENNQNHKINKFNSNRSKINFKNNKLNWSNKSKTYNSNYTKRDQEIKKRKRK